MSAADFTVDILADEADGLCVPLDCSLREAINAANIAGAGPHVISVPAGTLTVTADLPIVTDIQIVQSNPDPENRTIIDGGGTTRVFFVSEGPETSSAA